MRGENIDRDMNLDRIDEEYFVDRKGKIHKYKGDMDAEVISMHYEIANALYPDLRNPEDFVMNLGWILIGSSVYSHPIIHINPTQAQINKMFDLSLFDRLCILDNGYYPKFKDWNKGG